MTAISGLWRKVFEAKQFDLTRNLHFVTANEIKAITGHEPRIMAKIDTSRELPEVFRTNGYFLLPVRNGKYAILRGESFHRLEQPPSPVEHISRIKFQLTSAGRGSSEMQYVDYSYNAGALEKILGIPPLYQAIRGREFSRPFEFFVNRTPLRVQSVQLEVDSGLEGEDAIVLLEAKINTPKDFNIRQLFYPFRHFREIARGKQIVPVFFSYDLATKIYAFWIYQFTDPADYNSIKLERAQAATIVTEKEIMLRDIKPGQKVPYRKLVPQANDLRKVMELVFKVHEGVDNYQRVAVHFGFDSRQAAIIARPVRHWGCCAQDRVDIS